MKTERGSFRNISVIDEKMRSPCFIHRRRSKNEFTQLWWVKSHLIFSFTIFCFNIIFSSVKKLKSQYSNGRLNFQNSIRIIWSSYELANHVSVSNNKIVKQLSWQSEFICSTYLCAKKEKLKGSKVPSYRNSNCKITVTEKLIACSGHKANKSTKY